MADEPEVKEKKVVKKYEGPACSVCGKPLTDPESIKAGIGPLCRAAGWTKETVAAKMATLKRDAIPEGWVKLADVAAKCRAEGIPVTRLVRAVGGDRGMAEPASPIFSVIYVGRSRYLDPRVMKEEGLNLMRDKYLGKPAPEKKVKAPKEPKVVDPNAHVKAKKEKADAVSASDIWGNADKKI
jgi:hypothetical protein